MKRVLILKVLDRFPEFDHHDWATLSDAVAAFTNTETMITDASYDELLFEVSDHQTRIVHIEQGWDLASFDLVIFNKVGKDIELAIAAAHYLRAKNVPFIDEYIWMPGRGKLASSFLCWSNKLPVPHTLYARPEELLRILEQSPHFSFPFILKADISNKGKENYLVGSNEQLQKILESTDSTMIAQPLIENKGDYRVLVFNKKVALVIHRKGSGDSHLNNTSQGGKAVLIDPRSIDQSILDDCIKAAELEKLTVAGVDVIIDDVTKMHYILEVNRAPQVYSGSFVDEKLAAYAQMIEDILN